MRLLSLTLVSLFCLHGGVGTAFAKTFNAETMHLPNGLQVVVIPNHRVPVVTHMIWYKVGAADEAPGRSGMAHYFEHLMFKGTKKIAPGAFSKMVKMMGGNDNAFTSQDYTAFFQTIPAAHLSKVMEMEADRMFNLAPPPAHFMSEKKVVLEERRQRTENSPQSLFQEQVQGALFINHPYGTPVIGWMNEIETYQWDDVKAFYDTWYAPENAIVVISGDVTLEKIRPDIERIYGALPAKTTPKRHETKIPPAQGKTHITLRHKLIHQNQFYKVSLAPSAHQIYSDSLALSVLQEILSGGPTARLYHNLVVTQKKAISVDFSYDGGRRSYGSIWLSAIPADGVSLDEIDDLVQKEIDDVVEHGVRADEVSNAIQRLKDGAVFARDNITGPAMIVGRAMVGGQTLDQIENWTDAISYVTPQDVQRVARYYLDKDHQWIRPAVRGDLMPLLPKGTIQEGEEQK